MSQSTPGMQQQPASWDTVAPTYAEDVEQWGQYAHEALRLLPVQASHRALDVACGPGTLALLAAPHAASVDAVDFSPGMIAELNKRADRLGLKNVTGAVMDGEALAFADSTFDVAFNLFSFFFFLDRAKAFREMLRVLKPGGRALIATWSPIDRRPLTKIAFDSFEEAVPQFPRPAKGDLQDPAECVREMTAAGFRDVTAQTFTATVHVDSPERYLDLVVRSAAPIAVMRKKMGDEVWGQLRGKVLAAVRKRIPEGGAELANEAIFTLGTR